MSARRYRTRSELQADIAYEEELRAIRGGEHRTLNVEPRTSNSEREEFSAAIPRQEEGRVLIPRPDAGGARRNDAPPAV